MKSTMPGFLAKEDVGGFNSNHYRSIRNGNLSGQGHLIVQPQQIQPDYSCLAQCGWELAKCNHAPDVSQCLINAGRRDCLRCL